MKVSKEIISALEKDKVAPIIGNPNGKTIIYEFFDYNCGHCKNQNIIMNELIQAERVATEYALTVKNRLNRTIYLPVLNAFTLGELLFFFELETAYAGEMLNIDAYNQPGVENGKNATYALLGKKGYDEKKKELENAPKKGIGPQDVAIALIKAVFANGFVKNKVMEFVGPGVEKLSMDFRIGIK